MAALVDTLVALRREGGGRGGRNAFEGKGPPRRPQQRLDRRLEEVAKAVTNAVEAGTWRQGDSCWA